MIGQVLGSYRIVSRLGSGGMGTVWLAEHNLLGSRAAIKVLLPEMSAQQRIVERFFDEARAATRIQDPGIVTVRDFGWHAETGQAFIIMEHLQGETLTGRLARTGPLPPATALRLVQHCALAMAAAHARGIVHRDLKPDNIFIVPDPAVPGGERTKILDFGIAKLVDDADASHARTQTGMIMGTPAYMSPEQCRGAGGASGVDHRTDIYALGCVLFHLVVGQPPFVAPTAGDLIAMHLRETPPVPSALRPGLPPALDALVARCLAKAPHDRFQTMTDLVKACAAMTGEHLSIATIAPKVAQTEPPIPISTTLTSATGEATARPRRGVLFAVLGLGVAAAIAGVAIIASSQADRTPAPAAATAPPPASTAPGAAGAAAAPDAASSASLPADSAPIDAAAPPLDASPVVKPTRPPPPRSSTKSPAATPGSGSSTYDPYSDR